MAPLRVANQRWVCRRCLTRFVEKVEGSSRLPIESTGLSPSPRIYHYNLRPRRVISKMNDGRTKLTWKTSLLASFLKKVVLQAQAGHGRNGQMSNAAWEIIRGEMSIEAERVLKTEQLVSKLGALKKSFRIWRSLRARQGHVLFGDLINAPDMWWQSAESELGSDVKKFHNKGFHGEEQMCIIFPDIARSLQPIDGPGLVGPAGEGPLNMLPQSKRSSSGHQVTSESSVEGEWVVLRELLSLLRSDGLDPNSPQYKFISTRINDVDVVVLANLTARDTPEDRLTWVEYYYDWKMKGN